jgi:hypothetical protein
MRMEKITWGALLLVFFTNRQYYEYLGCEVEKDELTGPCNTNWREEKYSMRRKIGRPSVLPTGKSGNFF